MLLIVAATCQLAITAPIVCRQSNSDTSSNSSAWANFRDGLSVGQKVSFKNSVTISEQVHE